MTTKKLEDSFFDVLCDTKYFAHDEDEFRYRPLKSFRHSSEWKRFFELKKLKPDHLPWDEQYLLSREEKNAIASSMQQFELGENSAGRTLSSFAQEYARRSSDYFYPQALKSFIQEEQTHSALIRRFMEKQGIPCLKRHWVNGTFRGVRKLAGLELSVMVLVSAEIIACPYYRALGRATTSVLLSKICKRIQSDERHHLYFQAYILGKLRSKDLAPLRAIKNLFHSIMLISATLLVWRYHREVLIRGGYNYRRFVRACLIRLSFLKRLAARNGIRVSAVNKVAQKTFVEKENA